MPCVYQFRHARAKVGITRRGGLAKHNSAFPYRFFDLALAGGFGRRTLIAAASSVVLMCEA